MPDDCPFPPEFFEEVPRLSGELEAEERDPQLIYSHLLASMWHKEKIRYGALKKAIEKVLNAKKEAEKEKVPLFDYVMSMAERLINKADQLGETEKSSVVDYIKEKI